MMLCAYRDIATDEVVGLHRTRLDPMTGEKLGRKMLGRAGGAAIKLTHDSEVTMGLALAEGVESALAGMALGLVPIWAAGSVSGIAAFPVLSGIEALTICAETGAPSEKAVEEVGTRWTEAGREVDVVAPRTGSDLNDALMMETAR
ncbi:toprim domain-containing protein [Methylobacterium sp. E-065]|uniref:toprim domain-containing protein n=1 Tax=Methylobacterium sp. E-065 TaxID=2836583 RepID=UPI001FBA5615|nr:toprim domain-containing protein [Methylobacterium sp. E-065]MCJ2018026.1 toprim domain-containing protein [Methylobacterium sp. E-065]